LSYSSIVLFKELPILLKSLQHFLHKSPDLLKIIYKFRVNLSFFSLFSGSGFMSAGQIGGQRQDPQGEIRPSPPGQYVYNHDFQSGKIITYVVLEN